jgi:hypothetical protein
MELGSETQEDEPAQKKRKERTGKKFLAHGCFVFWLCVCVRARAQIQVRIHIILQLVPIIALYRHRKISDNQRKTLSELKNSNLVEE